MREEVTGRCPACRTSSLFLADGGYVTCGFIPCPDPTMVADVLDGTRNWPLNHEAVTTATDSLRAALTAMEALTGG